MIREISKKLTAMIMAIAMVLSYIMPVTTVFAYTIRKVNVTSSNIVARVVISEKQDAESGGWSSECFTDQGDACSINVEDNNDFPSYYISIEPDFFAGGRIQSIKINGVDKEVTSPTGRNTYKVDPLANYNVEVTGVAEEHFNIMWANSGAKVDGSDYDDPEILLQNGSAKIVKVYDNEEDMNDITDEIEHSEDGCVNPEGKGFVQLAEGNVVIFEFTPKYGYQLTSVSANGTKLEAQETMNQYKYIMPATNIHFQATFTKTSDVVKSATDKVTSGTVKIGKDEINAGSTVLSVKDATLTDAQKSTFATKAGEYKVSNVFDIKLDQVFYKGSTNANDVWSKPLGYSEDLQTPAVITLKLDEGVDGNTVVLIHEKEDGTYESIETTYDEATHTISFSTSSFSNYAIASKTVKNEQPKEVPKDEIKNPQTYDGLISWIVLSIISLSGIIGIIAYRKKQNI